MGGLLTLAGLILWVTSRQREGRGMNETASSLAAHAARMGELTARVQQNTTAMNAAIAEHRDTTPVLREDMALREEFGRYLRELRDLMSAADAPLISSGTGKATLM